ncbi:MAG: 16S rRNA (guanine(966)-N(2))-methyltransferase RsmD [SAR202 cluster bacterium Io17-Chloro-G7]|nr:MAG: 16S rRNA (guanine(966)-N(2))-methyltransferase RsmD [SAR202 cluster bacterium Io17-Chloro-G7]
MRVISGRVKGLRLKGAVSSGTRATTERARGAIFNILPGELYQEGRVLDIFAGSGSLGIEALSRGAGWADFVEWDRRQCEVIRTNLRTTGFSSHSKVHCADVNRFLSSFTEVYQLVLMDPPYANDELGPVMEKLGKVDGLIVEGGMLVVGHSRYLELLSEYGGLSRVSLRRYGDNVVEFFEKITTGKR